MSFLSYVDKPSVIVLKSWLNCFHISQLHTTFFFVMIVTVLGLWSVWDYVNNGKLLLLSL